MGCPIRRNLSKNLRFHNRITMRYSATDDYLAIVWVLYVEDKGQKVLHTIRVKQRKRWFTKGCESGVARWRYV